MTRRAEKCVQKWCGSSTHRRVSCPGHPARRPSGVESTYCGRTTEKRATPSSDAWKRNLLHSQQNVYLFAAVGFHSHMFQMPLCQPPSFAVNHYQFESILDRALNKSFAHSICWWEQTPLKSLLWYTSGYFCLVCLSWAITILQKSWPAINSIVELNCCCIFWHHNTSHF